MNYRIIDKLNDISGQRLGDVISMLPQWRQDIVMRYKFESGRRESAVAFRLLQDMLAESHLMTETEMRNMEFILGEHGKPSIKNHENIHFNLSHCKNAVACAISDNPIGIDVECIGRYSEGFAKYTLSETELHNLYYDDKGDKRDDDGIHIQFTLLWTKKEALLKLLGTGITDDLKCVLDTCPSNVSFETIINTDKKYVCTVARQI